MSHTIDHGDPEMKYLGLTAAILISGVAVAQQETQTGRTMEDQPAQRCLDGLEQAKKQYDQAQLSESARNEVRQLSQSAKILGERGDQEGCQNIVESIESITEDDRSRMQEEQSMQALRNAQPVTEYSGIVKASAINGTSVRNMENEELGTIEETVIDPRTGEISYVALSVGGFVGVGERLIAVPWEELRIVEGEEGMQGDETYYVVEASKSYLEQRQALGEGDWPQELTDEWNPSQSGSEEPRQQ
jgi:sporulation protein YlmC with PRC-barrel domain